MKNKFARKRMVATIGLLCFLVGQAWAAGIVLKIPNNGLENEAGGKFNPDYNGTNASSANVEFFKGAIPSPKSTTDFFAPAYTSLAQGTLHQYADMSLNGDNVYVRSWSGTPRIQGSYYGKSKAYAAASGTAPAAQYNVESFKTDYKADIPTNAPVITGVIESNERIGDTQDVKLNLTVSFTYALGTPMIEADGYKVKYWLNLEIEPADDDPTWVVAIPSFPFILPKTDPKTGKPFGAGTYHFKVRAKNEFGDGPWSTPQKDWPTLSGAGSPAGPAIQTFLLTLESGVPDKPGINFIALPFAPDENGKWYAFNPSDKSPINFNHLDGTSNNSIKTALDLVSIIPSWAKQAGIVKTFGKWSGENQLDEGKIIKIKSSSDPVVTELNNIILKQGEGYQVYIGKASDGTNPSVPIKLLIGNSPTL